ncbi:MAG: hypothetical protein A2V81_05120 [Candidatus Abawacabacteria bacterium RBG_16_42_10]|uniref:Uncharacterized protein n=1 Tax=Candidatus Abawacabacteria bacterium RBG_16_42_10 TaxID=1817814 RepID=A0A1F4XIU4_9BACT|nr:MAG: hypothetical protein A2V81_05120 [Candidatus Abawacabacteria bacterium RBG_16_42_10]
MKKFVFISSLIALTIGLSACGANSSGNENDIAKKYGITVEQYREIKKAAEGMGMSVESHLDSLGFTSKE